MLLTAATWVLTDGKAGDEQPCLGVAEALGLKPEIRRVRRVAPFSWLMPWGPVDPRERPGAPAARSRRPSPTSSIGVGPPRRAVSAPRQAGVARAHLHGLPARTRAPAPRAADLIWVPEHDRLRGANVIDTLTPPHRFSPERLAAARAAPDPRLAALPRPASRCWPAATAATTASRGGRRPLRRPSRGSPRPASALMVTASRRTPARPARGARAASSRGTAASCGTAPAKTPISALLALADAIVVTADSFNMIGEAAATGAPDPGVRAVGRPPQAQRLPDGLEATELCTPSTGRLEGARYEPLNSTPIIAEAIAEGLARHRRALGLPERPPARRSA